ncbi:MAG: leucyl aminopeptidase [Nitrosopumilaceae archaeon]|nr:leucyl aminopeptidase [Nitrosopumilaceae archaeon]NIU00477.1 leucyl aminopeptidase [Nitrosopumilaceae archaeon]NIU86860.1 leucyl aminopeptidase [Nitrosopumilaceae archaeon]NIV65540.1 leucyl aminopeptidase [Nitrosopumilaceae archaeon]NIX61079.1 leucyl aminopeptidase [Nitrosopumilaceae archaeon]
MKIKVDSSDPLKKKTEILCAFSFNESVRVLDIEEIDKSLDSAITKSIKEIKGKAGKISITQTLQRTGPERILIAGLGKKSDFNNDTIRYVAGKVAKKIHNIGLSELSIIVPSESVTSKTSSIVQIIEGVKLALYSFDKFKKEKNRKVQKLTLLVPKSSEISKTVKFSETITDAVLYTRDVANLPANKCSPATLEKLARSLTSKTKIKCKVLSKNELKKKGFGGITAVGQGSKNEPKLITLEYKNGKPNDKPTVIVGKAVTFDTGGISLKPSEKMDEMKFDKCGGCTVLGIMKAVSELNLPINVIGIIPSVENMPGGESYRPGDIVKLYSGKTAEILNTDAEGRLILADALAFGEKKYSPKEIIDFATLTGACIVSLGNNVAGMITNEDKLEQRVIESSRETMEEIWRLPLNKDHMDMIKSEVADMKNVGIGKAAGTITAAAFLKNAITNTPWIHFDIAGVAWIQQATKNKPYNPKGATGFGVRLVLNYLTRI